MRPVLLPLFFLALVACSSKPAAITAETPMPRLEVKPKERPPLDTHGPAMAMREAHVSNMPPPPMCEPGEKKSCGFTMPSGRNMDGTKMPSWEPMMTCFRDVTGQWIFSREDCATPLVLSFDGAAVEFTRSAGSFTVGPFPRTEWVSAKTPWLALDTDGSGCVESQAELFGIDGDARNGFEKLARLDANRDGRIDADDEAFSRLVLWFDRDQDRVCTTREIVPLADAGVTSIDLAWTKRERTRAGSFEGETSTMTLHNGAGRVIDVYLSPM